MQHGVLKRLFGCLVFAIWDFKTCLLEIKGIEVRRKQQVQKNLNQNPLVISVINPGHALLTELQQELE